jgi:hypothetical protein
MNGRTFLQIVLVLVLIAVLVGAGVMVYNAGIAQGLASNGKLALPDGGTTPYPYAGPFLRPWGFGFGLFGLIGPLLFLLLIFALLRGVFFAGRRGSWGWRGPRGDWPKDVPPMVEEWHRKMHDTSSTNNP